MSVTLDQLCSLQELSVVQVPHCSSPPTCSSLTGTTRDPTLTTSPIVHHNGTHDFKMEQARLPVHRKECGPHNEHRKECNPHSGGQQCVLNTDCRDCSSRCGVNRHSEHDSTACLATADHSGKSDASHLRQQWARHSKPKLQSPPTERYREDGLGESGREGSCKHQSCVPDTGADKPSPDHHHPHCSLEWTSASTMSSQPCRQLLKTQSMGSISSESLTISSLWEAPSYDTIPDFLSSLGFDDFDSPELIPDRFIPQELDFVRPSLMRQATLGSVSTDSFLLEPPLTPPSPPDDTAAAEHQVEPDHLNVPPQTLAIYLSSNSQLTWQPASLETVVEETGSEVLSLRPSSRLSARMTPRLTSPLLSIDHTPTHEVPAGIEGDVSTGLLGAGLAQRLRLQVLAKEDLRQRQMSLGGESDTSSLYFSVGSHFEDGEGEAGSAGVNREGEAVSTEEFSDTSAGTRRRRRGNYAPPPQLLMWLESAESTVDKADQPWPFSESPSPGHSPPGTLSASPSASNTLNNNTNNNCQHEFDRKLPLTAGDLPSQRGGVEIQVKLNQVQRQELDAVATSKLRDISNCFSSAYHRSSHTPT